MLSIPSQEHLIKHIIALILEACAIAIATIPTGTREDHNTTIPQTNQNVIIAKVNTASEGVTSLNRTRPSTS